MVTWSSPARPRGRRRSSATGQWGAMPSVGSGTKPNKVARGGGCTGGGHFLPALLLPVEVQDKRRRSGLTRGMLLQDCIVDCGWNLGEDGNAPSRARYARALAPFQPSTVSALLSGVPDPAASPSACRRICAWLTMPHSVRT